MVCMRVTFHENDGNHEIDENNSDCYKQGGESAGLAEITETTVMTKTTGNPELFQSLFGHFLVTFSDVSVTFCRHFFANLLLPDSSCGRVI